ncbi:hypothetical protein WJX74_006749 [Apatococcus lobatus]|uniref:Uncharacterized protein n=1 Tax=Apatococcus lobatus TaxID=904363 RepID=A0AAW1QCH5_9CHLO
MLHLRTLSRRRRAHNGAHTSWARSDVQEVDLLQLDGLLKPQQDPVCTRSPICTFLDPEVINTTLDGLNYMAGRAEVGKAVERPYMPITYIEGEAGLGKSTMAVNLHRGMQDVCRSPEGQLKWPHAAKLLNDPGATSKCLLNFNGSRTDSGQLAEADRELLSQPDRIWGIRIMARAHFKVSTAALRRTMKDRGLRVPPALWSMSNVAAFLRIKHQGQKLWLLELFVDEFPLIQEQAAQFDLPDHTLQRISKTLVYELVCFATKDQTDSAAHPCEAARHGMVLLPGIFDAYRAVMENLAGVPGAIAMEVFGYRAFSEARKKGLGGAKARLKIFLLAATGTSVARDLQIGESERQTLEEAACTGIFTLEPVPRRPGLTRVRIMPLRMEALSASLDHTAFLIPKGLLPDDLVPHLQVPVKPAALDTMIAARLAAQAVLASRLCGRHTLRVGDLLGAAKCADPALLRLRVKVQPLRVVRATRALLKKLPKKGTQEEARVAWVAGSTVKVAPYTANRALDTGRVEEVPALDPTRITLLDTPGDAMNAFDAQVLFDASQAGAPSVNLFASAKRRAPKNSDIIDELLSENHELARQSIREQGFIQNFCPIFVYVSTASTDKLDETLERPANQGQHDILVVSEDELCTFLPVVASQPSLVALTGSKVLGQMNLSIGSEPA